MERNIANVDNGNSSAPLALCTIPTKTEAQLYIYTLWSYKTTPSFSINFEFRQEVLGGFIRILRGQLGIIANIEVHWVYTFVI